MLTTDQVLQAVDRAAEEGYEAVGCHASPYDLVLYAVQAALTHHGVPSGDTFDTADATASAIIRLLDERSKGGSQTHGTNRGSDFS